MRDSQPANPGAALERLTYLLANADSPDLECIELLANMVVDAGFAHTADETTRARLYIWLADILDSAQ